MIEAVSSASSQNLGLRLSQCSFGSSKRERYPYLANETPSYVPNLFLGDGTSQLKKKYLQKPVEKILKSKEVTDFKEFVESLKEDIQNHIETRLQLFFMLLLMVSQTKLIFHKYSTKAQAGCQKKEKQEDSPAKLVEAHASTLPNLQFITMDQRKTRNATQIDPYILAIGSACYKYLHTTHKMPLFVNDIDSLIDKSNLVPFYDNFRHYCLKIVNDVSINSPSFIWNGYKAFLLTLQGVVKRALALKNHKKEYKVLTLKLYQNVVNAYIEQFNDTDFRKRLTFNQETSLSDCVQEIQKNIGIQVQCHIEFKKLVEKLAKNGIYKIDLLVKCILISLTNSKIRFIDKYLEINNINLPQPDYTKIEKCIKNEKIAAVAKEILEKITDYEKIKQNLSPLITEIKTRMNFYKIDSIAIRVLAKTSLKLGWNDPNLHKMCHYLSISGGRVADTLIDDTGEFSHNWETFRQDPEILTSYQKLNKLLDGIDPQTFCMNFLIRVWDRLVANEAPENIADLIQASAQSDVREFPRIEKKNIRGLGCQTHNYQKQIHLIECLAQSKSNLQKMSAALLTKREEHHVIVIDARTPEQFRFYHFNLNVRGSFHTFDQANKLAAHLDKKVPIEAGHPVAFQALIVAPE